MPYFIYTGKKLNGETVRGRLESSSEKDVIIVLRRQNIYPTKIIKDSIVNQPLNLMILQRIKIKDLAVFCRQFYALLEAGISILDCLNILRIQTENKKLQRHVHELFEEVQKGQNLSEAMKKFKNVFPKILISMVETGEVSGQLDVVMDRMATHFEKEEKINQKIQNAMIYPIIICIVSLIVIWFLIAFVLPNFINIFQDFGVILPLPTRILLTLGNWMSRFWYVVPFVILINIYGFKKYRNTETGRRRIDYLLLSLPIIGNVNRKIVTSRFSRTLAILISSGIPIIEAIEIVMRVTGNVTISGAIQKSMDHIKKGMGIADPLKELNIFPPMLISMIKIGEESGSLDAMLAKTAEFYDSEVESAVDQMTTLIEPLVIVVLAVVVGLIVVSIVLPMFEIFNQIGM